MKKSAFSGIKVADFTWWTAGPLFTKTLADYGATVVLIESMKKPSMARTPLPFKDNKPGLNRSGMFAYQNANKYSVTIDLDNSKGIEVAKMLVGWADVVVENFRPGVMEKWGLGYDQLRKIKPDTIMLRASSQGQTGPFSKHRALGLQLTSLSGIVHYTGWSDREPLSPMFAYSDYFAPWPWVAVLVAALDCRQRTGKGQLIDLSQYEFCLQFLAPYLLQYHCNGEESVRTGNLHCYAAPHNAYPCKGNDCWCTIAVFTDGEWKNFCEVLGNPSWSKDPKFATMLERKRNEEELDRLIGKWTVNYTPNEIMELMQKAGVAAGVVKKGEDLYQDPQLRERGFFWELPHKEMGNFTHMGQPSVLSETPAQPRMPAPCLGEHTEYVCKEFLGMSEEQFDMLLVDGAFGL